jgi:hypothetical protein
MSTINNLITKNRPNFELWERQLGEHLLSQYEPEANELGTDSCFNLLLTNQEHHVKLV